MSVAEKSSPWIVVFFTELLSRINISFVTGTGEIVTPDPCRLLPKYQASSKRSRTVGKMSNECMDTPDCEVGRDAPSMLDVIPESPPPPLIDISESAEESEPEMDSGSESSGSYYENPVPESVNVQEMLPHLRESLPTGQRLREFRELNGLAPDAPVGSDGNQGEDVGHEIYVDRTLPPVENATSPTKSRMKNAGSSLPKTGPRTRGLKRTRSESVEAESEPEGPEAPSPSSAYSSMPMSPGSSVSSASGSQQRFFINDGDLRGAPAWFMRYVKMHQAYMDARDEEILERMTQLFEQNEARQGYQFGTLACLQIQTAVQQMNFMEKMNELLAKATQPGSHPMLRRNR